MVPSVPLIYEDNRAFLKGKREKLAQPEEVIDNLSTSIGVKAPPVFSGCAGCASLYTLGLGVMGTALGIIMLVAASTSFGSILHAYPTPPNHIAIAALLFAAGMVFLVLIGHRYILQTYWTEQYPTYITRLYKELVAQGKIVEGIIISIEQGTPQIVHYRLNVPPQCENCVNQYRLFTQMTLMPGQKVTVLYLNRCVQTLL